MSVPPPSVSPAFCPNCGVQWSPDTAVCPNCGFIRPAWPPPPVGSPSPTPGSVLPASKLVTGSAAGDILLGLALGAGSFALCGLGLLVIPILYFALRRGTPSFASGLGYGFLVGVVLLLGAFAACYYGSQGTSQPW